jgi:hypothetical protein
MQAANAAKAPSLALPRRARMNRLQLITPNPTVTAGRPAFRWPAAAEKEPALPAAGGNFAAGKKIAIVPRLQNNPPQLPWLRVAAGAARMWFTGNPVFRNVMYASAMGLSSTKFQPLRPLQLRAPRRGCTLFSLMFREGESPDEHRSSMHHAPAARRKNGSD